MVGSRMLLAKGLGQQDGQAGGPIGTGAAASNHISLHLKWQYSSLVFLLIIPSLCLILWVWMDYKRVVFKRFRNKLPVSVEIFRGLYFWTIQYHCVSRFCFQAQLPRAEKLLDWCDSRRKDAEEGIPVPNIVLETYNSAMFLGLSAIIYSTISLFVLLSLNKEGLTVSCESCVDISRTVNLLLAFLVGASFVGFFLMALTLEKAAVEWILTTSLHALSPVELAFGAATGIRLHTYQQALGGKGPDASEDWGDMSGSGQEDGIKLYTRHYTGMTDPFVGMAGLYPGDIPIKVFSTAITSLLTYLGIHYAGKEINTTTALLGLGVLALGAIALLLQLVLNLWSATRKLRRGTEQAYKAAALAYWSPRLPCLETFERLNNPSEAVVTRRSPSRVATESNLGQGVLTEADWCFVTGEEVAFDRFAKDFFPSLWTILRPIQWLDLQPELAKRHILNAHESYEYSPSETLDYLLKSIQKAPSTHRVLQGDRFPTVEGAQTNSARQICFEAQQVEPINVLQIGALKCGERKILISSNGLFDSEASKEQLQLAVVNDLCQLAIDVEKGAGIDRRYSFNWWMAQPSLDQFVGAVTLYRTLTVPEDRSYAPGIHAVLQQAQAATPGRKHRLQEVPHASRLELDELVTLSHNDASVGAWLWHYVEKLAWCFWTVQGTMCGPTSLLRSPSLCDSFRASFQSAHRRRGGIPDALPEDPPARHGAICMPPLWRASSLETGWREVPHKRTSTLRKTQSDAIAVGAEGRQQGL